MHAILTILYAGDHYHFTWTSAAVSGLQLEAGSSAPQNSICLHGTTYFARQQAATLHEHINMAAQTLNLAPPTLRSRPPAPPSDAGTAFDSLGKLLFSQLVPEQIRLQLRNLPAGSTLQIATDDVNLPWELLHDGHDFLGLQHNIARLPLLPKPQPQHTPPERDARVSALLLGNPTGDLPETVLEIKSIADILYAARDRISYRALFGDHISALHLQDLLAQQKYDLIHFAGHARPGAIRLAEGDFRIDDILNSLHNHPLVILNACASGRVDAGAPDLPEMSRATQSLAGAFIQAGATAVVAMLWPIPDKTAGFFAETLYHHLVNGEGIGEALRLSRVQLRQHDPNGISWLAPVLYGDPRQRPIPVALKESSGSLLALRFSEPLVNQRKGVPPTPGNQAHHLALLCQRIAHHGGVLLHANESGLLAAYGLYQASASNAIQALLAARDAVALAATWHTAQPAAAIVSGDLAATHQQPVGYPTVDATATPFLFGPPVREIWHYLDAASPGQILLNQLARDRCQNHFHCRPWRGSTASGQTITGYELISAPVEVASGTLMFDLSVLVGREGESKRLDEAWQEARRGHGQVVGVSGEAGIGKTHLVQTFRKTLPPDDAHWLQVVCTAQTQHTPYGLLARLFRTLLAIPDHSDEDALATALPARFAGSPGDSSAVLMDLLGAEQQTGQRQEQAVYQHQLYKVLAQLLLQEARQRPLVLVLEDAHLSDSASIDVFTLLVNTIEAYPILLILPHRPEWQAPWAKKGNYQSIVLRQLDRPTRQRLYEVLLGAQQLPAELLTLVERASGNPLFLTQILVTLVAKGLLTTKESAAPQWQVAGMLEPRDLPDSVQLIIDMRLDRLDAAARTVLALAAVLGSNITPARLLWGSSISEERLFTHLKTLTDEDFLRHEPISDVYEFRHELIRDVVYLKIAIPQRQLWHRQVAASSERRDSRRRESVALLAHHYYLSLLDGGSPDQPLLNRESDQAITEKALTYLMQSGQDALDRYGGQEAVTLFQRASHVHGLLPLAGERQAHIYTCLGDAYNQIGNYAQAAQSYAEAHALLHRHPLTPTTRPQVAHLARLLARLHMRWAEYELAEAWIESGLERVRGFADVPCQSAVALLQIHAGSVNYNRGEFARAAQSCQAGLKIAETIADTEAQAEGHFILGAILQSSGQNDAALAAYQRALEMRQAQQNLYQIHRVEMNIGVAYFAQSAWSIARTHYEQARRFWQTIGEPDLLALTSLNMGVAELYLGNWSQAEGFFRSALEIWEEMQNQRSLALCYSNLGTLFIEQEAWSPAKTYLERCLGLVQTHGIQDYLPDVWNCLAQVALAEGEVDQAVSLAAQASQLAAEKGVRLYQALALRTEGCAQADKGDHEAAYKCLVQSQAILDELGDRYELARTNVQLARVLAEAGRTADASALCAAAVQVFEQLSAAADLRRAQTLYDRLSTQPADAR